MGHVERDLEWIKASGLPSAAIRLETGRVVGTEHDGRPRIVIGAETVVVTPALQLPYSAEVGDLLLVIGSAAGWYAIGVVEGRGTTRLLVPGDLEVAAPQGDIRFAAGRAVMVHGAAFEVACRRVSITAETLMERCREAGRWVAGLFEVRAKQTTTTVQDVHMVRAGNIVEIADRQMKLDGEQIHLG